MAGPADQHFGTGSIGRRMGARMNGRLASHVDLVFSGKIACPSFIDFARHRAARLDLGLELGPCDAHAVRVRVSGQEALVDMFEMACSLGPYDCIIHDIKRTDINAGTPPSG